MPPRDDFCTERPHQAIQWPGGQAVSGQLCEQQPAQIRLQAIKRCKQRHHRREMLAEVILLLNRRIEPVSDRGVVSDAAVNADVLVTEFKAGMLSPVDSSPDQSHHPAKYPAAAIKTANREAVNQGSGPERKGLKSQRHRQPAQHSGDADVMDQLGPRQTKTGRQQNDRQPQGADDLRTPQHTRDHIRSRVAMPSRPRPNLRVSAVKRQRARRDASASGSALSTGTWS